MLWDTRVTYVTNTSSQKSFEQENSFSKWLQAYWDKPARKLEI